MSSDPVLAIPPGDCCLNSFPHEGAPKGTFIPIAEVQTYISRPPTSAKENRVILYFPDVWGIDTFVNGQLLCDFFAAQGFLVLALDYFRGDPVHLHRKSRTEPNPGFDYEEWKAKHQAFAKVAVPKWIDAVKEQFGTPETKYAAVGYCFGAPYVMDALSESSSTACVGAFAHPAFLNESHFINCARPILLSCAQTDHTFPTASRHRAEELLMEKNRTFQVQLFSGIEHGFALRGNMEDAYERYTKEESASGIVRWFDRFMA
ncbi:dienelactone hydrolase [Roridomyces roridus]|uniref:Dienelactone hydrolase n=1 Tax=Roridomyces roridus TaxID=1738132 RepID=A0AAD7BN31_9AGAR|nr:dienelactone hydrolase [Roridomyces roridus]